MWAITEAVVSPVVGYQVRAIPVLSQVLGLSKYRVCVLSLNTSWHSGMAAAGSGSEWFCPLLKLVSEGHLMELHWPSPQLSGFNRLISWRKLPKLLL